MTIQEALKISKKIRLKDWPDYKYLYVNIYGLIIENSEECHIFSQRELLATDWEPVIEKKKLCKALYKVGSSYIISAEYYETSNDVKHLGFIKLLPHTEIEV